MSENQRTISIKSIKFLEGGVVTDILFPVPPLAEQGAVVEGIEVLSKNILIALESSKQESSLPHEFRTLATVEYEGSRLDLDANSDLEAIAEDEAP